MSAESLRQSGAASTVRGFLGSYRRRDGGRGIGASGPVPSSLRNSIIDRLVKTDDPDVRAEEIATIDAMIREQRRATNAAKSLDATPTGSALPRVPAVGTPRADEGDRYTYTVKFTPHAGQAENGGEVVVVVTSPVKLTALDAIDRARNHGDPESDPLKAGISYDPELIAVEDRR